MNKPTPQNIYDDIVNKPIDENKFIADLKITLKSSISGSINEPNFIKNKAVDINAMHLDSKYFQGNIEDKTYKFKPVCQQYLKDLNWKVSYRYPDHVTAMLHLSPIKPIKEKIDEN